MSQDVLRMSQVVCPHCGQLAPMTDTRKLKRLRRSIAPDQKPDYLVEFRHGKPTLYRWMLKCMIVVCWPRTRPDLEPFKLQGLLLCVLVQQAWNSECTTALHKRARGCRFVP